MGNRNIREFANVSDPKNENFATYMGLSHNSHKTKRSLILWEVPHIGSNRYIEMYINPQNMRLQSRKEIQKIRTKGGYIAQYWGEDLDTIAIQGITGDSGIEGMNVLRDIYRSEQLSMTQIATGRDPSIIKRQSLMQLAASITMHYQNQSYRGFFTDMQFTENVEHIGYMDYIFNFTIVETRGVRKNFLPWHRHPWSTTENPNKDSNQAISGGGYAPGSKVGALNAMPYDMQMQKHLVPTTKRAAYKFVNVAILRADPKDARSGRTFIGSASHNKAKVVNTFIAKNISSKQKKISKTDNKSQKQ